MAQTPSERARAISRRPVHVRYLGDVTAAAAWRQYALKQRAGLLQAGDATLARVLHPAPGVEVRIQTTAFVDVITIQANLADVGLVLEARTNPDAPLTVHQLLLEDKPPPKPPAQTATAKFRHPFSKKELLGGNIDWTSADGKTCLTWQGPPGRSIGERIEPFRVKVNRYITNGDPGFYPTVTGGVVRQLRYVTYLTEESWEGAKYYAVDRLDATVWKRGKVWARAPEGHVVLGAALIRHVVAGRAYRHAVLVTRPELEAARVELLGAESFHTLSFWWALPPTGSTFIKSTDWTRFHQAELYEYKTLPMMGFVAFSGSGLKFAALVPTRVEYEYLTADNISSVKLISPGRGNDLIVEGVIVPGAEGLAMGDVEITPQPHGAAECSGSTHVDHDWLDVNEEAYPGETDLIIGTVGNYSFTRTQSDSAIVAVDYVGEQRVTLTASLECSHSSHNEFDDHNGDDPYYILWNNFEKHISASNHAEVSISLRMTDVHRKKSFTVWSVTANQNGSYHWQHNWTREYRTHPTMWYRNEAIRDDEGNIIEWIRIPVPGEATTLFTIDQGGGASGSNSGNDEVAVNRPVYYDLRHGTHVLEQGLSTSRVDSTVQSVTEAIPWTSPVIPEPGEYIVIGDDPNPPPTPQDPSTQGLTTSTTNVQYTLDLSKQVLDHREHVLWETTRSEDKTIANEGTIGAIDLAAPSEIGNQMYYYPIGQQAGYGACHNAALPWLQQWTIPPGSVDGIAWVERYAKNGSFISLGFNLMYMPYYPDWQLRRQTYSPDSNVSKALRDWPLHVQRGPRDDELVVCVDAVLATPDLDNWTTHFATKEPRHCVFATGFDVDAAWQAHLDAKHPDPPRTATALEAVLKPLFRM